MNNPPTSGDILRIPSYTASSEENGQWITWGQDWSERSAGYYTVHAKNVSKDDSDVLLFVQSNWYNADTSTTEDVSKIVQKMSDGSFEVMINSRFQYGQQDKEGRKRFVVYHDKFSKPSQRRFTDTLVQSKVAHWMKDYIPNNEVKGMLGLVGDIFGGYLQTF